MNWEIVKYIDELWVCEYKAQNDPNEFERNINDILAKNIRIEIVNILTSQENEWLAKV